MATDAGTRDVGARNVRTAEFKAMLGRCGVGVRRLALLAYRQFLADPSHASLRFHELGDTHRGRHRAGSFSVAVTMKYRAIAVRDGVTNVWYWFGTHNDYENFTGRK